MRRCRVSVQEEIISLLPPGSFRASLTYKAKQSSETILILHILNHKVKWAFLFMTVLERAILFLMWLEM